jgi:hypothetical protein
LRASLRATNRTFGPSPFPDLMFRSQIDSCAGQVSAGSILRERKVTGVGNIGDDG